ncbi:MAG: hypothetical protein RL154_1447 [Pseudomonadota bacterium]|jgi:dephospho-CoA kinase
MEFKNCVVITGGIACGKSTMCDILQKLGYTILNADLIARDALNAKKEEVFKIFDCKDEQNEIDRAKLGAIVFNSALAKKQLEDIVHPEMFTQIYNQAQALEEQNKLYFLDFPLFFETGQKQIPKAVVVVYITQEMQLKRLMGRNTFSRQEALARINSQIDIEQKKSLAQFVIDNSGSQDALYKQTLNLLERLK